MIAALYVETGGVYYGLPDVDPWDKERDARLYAGPWPVVAHPPCAAWCRLAGLRQHRYGYPKGEDDGCFESALASVRRWGGVLEHPAYSDAWGAFGLVPPRGAGWQFDISGAMVAEVAQSAYGHAARKRTWLYAFGIDPEPVAIEQPPGTAWVSWGDYERYPQYRPVKRDGRGPIGTHGEWRRRLGKKAALATPQAFRDLLLDMARTVKVAEAA